MKLMMNHVPMISKVPVRVCMSIRYACASYLMASYYAYITIHFV